MQPFELFEDPMGKLVLRRPGQEDAVDVRVRRAFPWSSPDTYVSLRGSDGKELLLIEDLTAIDPALRARLVDWIARHSFIPTIKQVEEVDVRFGYQQWRVTTDRGPAEFRVQEREDIRFLNDGRFSVKDADGNVYELPDLQSLDVESRRAVEALL